jgi:hypothetical protein
MNFKNPTKKTKQKILEEEKAGKHFCTRMF